MKQPAIFVLITLFALGTAWGQEKPTPEETRKVINYYYKGQGKGAVLMDLQLCEGIGQEEDALKNECLNRVDPGKVQLGKELHVWLNFMIPVNDAADILLTFSRKGKVRHTANVKLTSATRFRTWKRLPTDKAGQWTIAIIQELGNMDLELGSLQYKVFESIQ